MKTYEQMKEEFWTLSKKLHKEFEAAEKIHLEQEILRVCSDLTEEQIKEIELELTKEN